MLMLLFGGAPVESVDSENGMFQDLEKQLGPKQQLTKELADFWLSITSRRCPPKIKTSNF